MLIPEVPGQGVQVDNSERLPAGVAERGGQPAPLLPRPGQVAADCQHRGRHHSRPVRSASTQLSVRLTSTMTTPNSSYLLCLPLRFLILPSWLLLAVSITAYCLQQITAAGPLCCFCSTWCCPRPRW